MASSQQSQGASSSGIDSSAPSSSAAFSFKRKYSSQAVSDSEDSDSDDGAASWTKSTEKKPRLSTADEAKAIELSASCVGTSKEQHPAGCFGLYLTRVSGINEENISGQFKVYSLRDVISNHSGKLLESIQFNYMFEIDWLVAQYPKESRSAPLTLVHGNQGSSKTDLDVEAMAHAQVNLVQARLDMPYGTHHSKLMILRYADGLRVVVHTANLIERDWHQKTQCGWLSPLLKPVPAGAAESHGDSPTQLRADLCRYLRRYRHPRVGRWADLIEGFDFSGLRVFLIASCPGRHSADQLNDFGHLKLRKTLRQFSFDSNESAAFVGQFSSIGSLGKAPEAWLTGEFLASIGAGGPRGRLGGGAGNSALKLIYPTKDDVRQSLEGFPAGGSLPYRQSVARQQPWLNSFLHSWSAKRSNRSRAMPHMKSYLRYDASSHNRLSWYLVTSANLSKAAWGCLEKQGTQLAIRSYELGVLLVAKQFDLPEFSLESSEATAYIPVPFDLPPVRYKASDKPWILDLAYRDLPDTHGNIWCPPMCSD